MSKKNKTDDDDSSYQDFAEFSVVFTNWQEKKLADYLGVDNVSAAAGCNHKLNGNSN
jgi:hypothetical protein